MKFMKPYFSMYFSMVFHIFPYFSHGWRVTISKHLPQDFRRSKLRPSVPVPCCSGWRWTMVDLSVGEKSPRVMFSKFFKYFLQYTLRLFNIAMENGLFIEDFPINTSIYKRFSMAMLNNQMVVVFLWGNSGAITGNFINSNLGAMKMAVSHVLTIWNWDVAAKNCSEIIQKTYPRNAATGWWFGTFFIFPYIIPTDPNWLIFSEGLKRPTRYSCFFWWVKNTNLNTNNNKE